MRKRTGATPVLIASVVAESDHEAITRLEQAGIEIATIGTTISILLTVKERARVVDSWVLTSQEHVVN